MSTGGRVLRLGDSLGVVLGLSKLLHQEDALGAPCLDTVIVTLHGYPGEAECYGRRIRHFDVRLRFATPGVRLSSAEAFAVMGGGCTGRAHGCKAKQGSHGRECPDVWFLPPQ
jgi:hypothetical protein